MAGYQTAGILFFDTKGYSKLDDTELRAYHERLWPMLYESNDFRQFLYINTWGDGIIMLHDDYEILIQVALSIRDFFRQGKYTSIDIFRNKELSARIAIHLGEFLKSYDPFRECDNYLGREIIRCARIEPIIEPGYVWATDEIKVQVERRWQNAGRRPVYNFIEQGEIPLAKAFGTEHLWAVDHT